MLHNFQMMYFTLLALYAGLIIGVSFSAAIKFSASTLTLATGLEIGHITFNLFNKIEWVLLIALSVTALSRYKITWALLCCYIFLLIQTVYLLPKLNERVMLFTQGVVAEKSLHHLAYITCEASKILLLFCAMYLYSRHVKTDTFN